MHSSQAARGSWTSTPLGRIRRTFFGFFRIQQSFIAKSLAGLASQGIALMLRVRNLLGLVRREPGMVANPIPRLAREEISELLCFRDLLYF